MLLPLSRFVTVAEVVADIVLLLTLSVFFFWSLVSLPPLLLCRCAALVVVTVDDAVDAVPAAVAAVVALLPLPFW